MNSVWPPEPLALKKRYTLSSGEQKQILQRGVMYER
jgi:hypothetical protein